MVWFLIRLGTHASEAELEVQIKGIIPTDSVQGVQHRRLHPNSLRL
jgi:hypothetical protein